MVKLAYLELFGQNARLTEACAATYPDSGPTDGHEGPRRDPYPGPFKAVLRLVKTAKITGRGKGSPRFGCSSLCCTGYQVKAGPPRGLRRWDRRSPIASAT